MQDTVAEILQREADRLNEQSKAQQLSTTELGYLDKLIKIYKTFINESYLDTPEAVDTAALLDGITNSQAVHESTRPKKTKARKTS